MPKNQHTQRKLLFFRIGLKGRCQKVPKFDSQSQFSMSKIIRIFLIFSFIEEYQLRYTFFVFDIFWSHQFLNNFIFWNDVQFLTPLHNNPILKFNDFLWVCWFLGKNLSYFVPPVWKLHNPYCHNLHASIWFLIKFTFHTYGYN